MDKFRDTWLTATIFRSERVKVGEDVLYNLPPDSATVRHLCIKPDEAEAVIAAVSGGTLTRLGQTYRPSGVIEWPSVAKGVGASLALSLPVALLFSLLPFGLIFISALVLAGIAVFIAIRFVWARHIALGVVVGAVVAGGSYLTWQWLEYEDFRGDLRAEISQQRPDLTWEELDQQIERGLEEQVGASGVVGYIQYKMRVSRAGGGASQEPHSLVEVFELVLDVINSENLSGVWFLILHLAELVFVIALGVAAMVLKALAPYCEVDRMDMVERRLFPALPGEAQRLTEALVGERQTPEARALLDRVRAFTAPVFLELIYCPVCYQAYPRWQMVGEAYQEVRTIPLGHLDGDHTREMLTVAGPLATEYARRESRAYLAFVKEGRQDTGAAKTDDRPGTAP